MKATLLLMLKQSEFYEFCSNGQTCQMSSPISCKECPFDNPENYYKLIAELEEN